MATNRSVDKEDIHVNGTRCYLVLDGLTRPNRQQNGLALIPSSAWLSQDQYTHRPSATMSDSWVPLSTSWDTEREGGRERNGIEYRYMFLAHRSLENRFS